MEGSCCMFQRFLSMAFWYFVMPIALGGLLRWVASRFIGGGSRKMKTEGKTMIILGSGGHTKEILSLSKALSISFNPRIYVSTQSDQLSLEKARAFEEKRKNGGQVARFYSVLRIRDVGQSLISALLFRAPRAFIHSTILMIKERPDVLLCNGPGVCVLFCIIASILNVLRVSDTRIIYVESICRVKTLSLSGRILIRLAHDFIVQWKDLQVKCQAQFPESKVLYLGRLS